MLIIKFRSISDGAVLTNGEHNHSLVKVVRETQACISKGNIRKKCSSLKLLFPESLKTLFQGLLFFFFRSSASYKSTVDNQIDLTEDTKQTTLLQLHLQLVASHLK